jgi:hypothetical protein
MVYYTKGERNIPKYELNSLLAQKKHASDSRNTDNEVIYLQAYSSLSPVRINYSS